MLVSFGSLLDFFFYRCMSSKELKTLAPPSGSPYEYMLHKKEELEATTRQRLQEIKLLTSAAAATSNDGDQTPTPPPTVVTVAHNINTTNNNSNNADLSTTSSTSAVRRRAAGANESRNRKRSMHNKAVVNDLCDIVADLFIAESKLLKPLHYGVPEVAVVAAAAGRNNDGTASSSNTSLGEGQRLEISRRIHDFVSALPLRYALSADTPSEVLLHMRLMAAARSDRNKAVVHIHNLQDEHDNEWVRRLSSVASGGGSNASRHYHQSKSLRLVTISCHDAQGLLELITKALATGGSSVLDADVMLSTDGIVLDRFVVEMNGRLRLDKLAQLIESHLKQSNGSGVVAENNASSFSSPTNSNNSAGAMGGEHKTTTTTNAGPIYFKEQESPKTRGVLTPLEIQREMETAVPLSEILASNSSRIMLPPPDLPRLRKMHSMPSSQFSQHQQQGANINTIGGNMASYGFPLPSTRLAMRKGISCESIDGGVSIPESPPHNDDHQQEQLLEQQQQNQQTRLSNNGLYYLSGEPAPTSVTETGGAGSVRRHPRRPLVNRRGSSDLDQFGRTNSGGGLDVSGLEEEEHSLDYVTVPSSLHYDGSGGGGGAEMENRVVPLIPFDELMLIETIGTGRVSTIYRAAWQHGTVGREHLASVHMVALKVAMVNPETGDPSHVDELRREADIAARLQHPNIADLVGVAADAECFCLAYDFCEGGSLLSLLSDSKRYYEYLPIALDIANGMAYLHSRNVIHRDLKPSVSVVALFDHFLQQQSTTHISSYRSNRIFS
jgi:Protein tyrosine and serine/threonine kinase